MTVPKVYDSTVFKEIITGYRHADILEQFQYNINTITLDTTLVDTGTVTQADGMAVISSGSGTNASAIIESKHNIRYSPGFEGYAYFTVLFENGGVANTVQYAGAFNTTDGYFIGYNGTDMVIGYRNDDTDTVVAEADWNGGDEQGRHYKNIDWTKLNIIRITWGWLGTAPVRFEICLSDGRWMTLHSFDFPSTRTVPSVLNPVLPICIDVTKTGADTTDVVVKTASWSGGTTHAFTNHLDRYFTGSISGTVSTESVLINFQNVSSFQSMTNLVDAEGVKLSMSSDGTKPAIVKIYKNLGITSPTWTNVDATNSIMQTDVVGTVTPNNANLLMEYNLAKSDSVLDDIEDIDFIIHPGETVTITGQSAANNDLTFTARWKEKF